MRLGRFFSGMAAVALVGGVAGAQPAGAPDDTSPPPPSLGPIVAPPAAADDSASLEPAAPAERARSKPIETGPPRPERSPTAILRVLDKVTAETLRFEAPVGRRVRFKSLVFEVRACDTWGVHAPQPRPSAYLIIDSDLGASAREVFRGWMFAQAPGLHALQHPVFDAWVESCAGAPAPSA
jgi:hypothetical protein